MKKLSPGVSKIIIRNREIKALKALIKDMESFIYARLKEAEKSGNLTLTAAKAGGSILFRIDNAINNRREQ